jgi:hypothetical protein
MGGNVGDVNVKAVIVVDARSVLAKRMPFAIKGADDGGLNGCYKIFHNLSFLISL